MHCDRKERVPRLAGTGDRTTAAYQHGFAGALDPIQAQEEWRGLVGGIGIGCGTVMLGMGLEAG